MKVALRKYQNENVEQIRQAIRQGHRSILYQLPVGGGKTVTMSAIIEGAKNRGSRVLFLAHRRELIWQTRNKLNLFGIEPQIFMGKEHIPLADKNIIVGTIQSVSSPKRRAKLGDIDVIIIDEAHRAMAPSYRKIASMFPNAILLGMTATPIRMDGKGLGYLFKHLVQGPTIPNLIQDRYLVEPKYYGPYTPDLRGVRVRGGDYLEADLERLMNRQELVGDVFEWWMRLAQTRKTIIFASSVAHSLHIERVFKNNGIRIAHVDGNTPTGVRDEIFNQLRYGDLQVLTNCDVATEGTDIPEVSAIVVARPTKSPVRWIQMIGRGLRIADGKKDCLVIDHGGTVYNLGFVEEWNEWRLSDEFVEKVMERAKSKEKKVTCPHCKSVFNKQEIVMTPEGPRCPLCIKVLPTRHRSTDIETRKGEIVRVDGTKQLHRLVSEKDKQQFYAELRWIQEERGYKLGWVGHRYMARYGDWPPNRWLHTVPPATPTRLTNYILRQASKKVVPSTSNSNSKRKLLDFFENPPRVLVEREV